MKKRTLLLITIMSLIVGTLFSTATVGEAKVKRDSGGYVIGQKLPKKPYKVNGVIIANKMHPLPSTYSPGESKTARSAFNRLNKAAKKAGYSLTAFSTYRSYSYQKTLFNRYVKIDGQKAADRYSARPGYSEHQTGLAFDIGETKRPRDFATNRFSNTKAGKWLAKHAHEYGFIMRYPKGKEKITGYQYESWHYRYVGKSLATKVYKKNTTLEEYFKIEG